MNIKFYFIFCRQIFNMDEKMEIFKLVQFYKIDWGFVLDGKVYEVFGVYVQLLGCEFDFFMLLLFVFVVNFMGLKIKIQII